MATSSSTANKEAEMLLKQHLGIDINPAPSSAPAPAIAVPVSPVRTLAGSVGHDDPAIVAASLPPWTPPPIPPAAPAVAPASPSVSSLPPSASQTSLSPAMEERLAPGTPAQCPLADISAAAVAAAVAASAPGSAVPGGVAIAHGQESYLLGTAERRVALQVATVAVYKTPFSRQAGSLIAAAYDHVAYAVRDNMIRVIRKTSGLPLKLLIRDHQRPLTDLRMYPEMVDERAFIASASADLFGLWSVGSGPDEPAPVGELSSRHMLKISTARCPWSFVRAVLCPTDPSLVAAVASDGRVHVLCVPVFSGGTIDLGEGAMECERTLENLRNDGAVRTLDDPAAGPAVEASFGLDGTLLLIGYASGEARLYDWAAGACVRSWHAHDSQISSAIVCALRSPGAPASAAATGLVLTAGSGNSELRLWNVVEERPVLLHSLHISKEPSSQDAEPFLNLTVDIATGFVVLSAPEEGTGLVLHVAPPAALPVDPMSPSSLRWDYDVSAFDRATEFKFSSQPLSATISGSVSARRSTSSASASLSLLVLETSAIEQYSLPVQPMLDAIAADAQLAPLEPAAPTASEPEAESDVVPEPEAELSTADLSQGAVEPQDASLPASGDRTPAEAGILEQESAATGESDELSDDEGPTLDSSEPPAEPEEEEKADGKTEELALPEPEVPAVDTRTAATPPPAADSHGGVLKRRSAKAVSPSPPPTSMVEGVSPTSAGKWCDLCGVMCPNEPALIEHKRGRRHQKLLAEQEEGVGAAGAVESDKLMAPSSLQPQQQADSAAAQPEKKLKMQYQRSKVVVKGEKRAPESTAASMPAPPASFAAVAAKAISPKTSLAQPPLSPHQQQAPAQAPQNSAGGEAPAPISAAVMQQWMSRVALLLTQLTVELKNQVAAVAEQRETLTATISASEERLLGEIRRVEVSFRESSSQSVQSAQASASASTAQQIQLQQAVNPVKTALAQVQRAITPLQTQLPQACARAVEDALAQKGFTTSVAGVPAAEIAKAVEAAVVPSFERVLGSAFSQAAQAMDRSLVVSMQKFTEAVSTAQERHTTELARLVREHSTELARAQRTAVDAGVAEQLRSSAAAIGDMSRSVTSFVGEVQRMCSNAGAAGAVCGVGEGAAAATASSPPPQTPPPQPQRPTLAMLQDQVRPLIAAEDFEQAITFALNQKNLDFVLWVLRAMPAYQAIQSVHKQKTGVLICLIQQLGTSLDMELPLKLTWLNEAVLELPADDPMVRARVSVLGKLRSALLAVEKSVPPASSRAYRTLMHGLLAILTSVGPVMAVSPARS